MPSHQDRRDPLPKDYQFPTCGAAYRLDTIYGVVDIRTGVTLCIRCESHRPLVGGVCEQCRTRIVQRHELTMPAPRCMPVVVPATLREDFHAVRPDPHCCPQCSGPSYRGGVCLNCTTTTNQPPPETPWGV